MLTALFEALKWLFAAVVKLTPSDAIREANNTLRSKLKEQDINQARLRDDFNTLKKHTEQDAWDYIRNTHPMMLAQELEIHHRLLEAKIIEYRKDIVKRKGLRWRKYKKWLEEQK